MFNLKDLQEKRNELEAMFSANGFERTVEVSHNLQACGDCSGSCSGTCNESCSGKCLGCGTK